MGESRPPKRSHEDETDPTHHKRRHKPHGEVHEGLGPLAVKNTLACFQARPELTDESIQNIPGLARPPFDELPMPEIEKPSMAAWNASPEKAAFEAIGLELESSDSQGSDSQGSDSQGSDSQGSDSQGSDSQGSDSQGSDPQGSDQHDSDQHDSDQHDSDQHDSDEIRCPTEKKQVFQSPTRSHHGTGLECMVVVLRRIFKHILTTPNALSVNNWMNTAEENNPILRHAWHLFGDSKEELTEARALAYAGLIEAFGDHMEPSEIFFEQLCWSSLMNETFWSQVEFSLFRPPVFLDTWEMVEQTPDEATDANMLEFDRSDHPEATLQDFVSSKFGVINQILYRPREPIVIRLLYRTSGLGGHRFDSLRQFFVPVIPGEDDRKSQSHYSVIAVVKMRMTTTSPDSVRTYPVEGSTVEDPLSGDYMFFYGLRK
ncbi:hypothetical protein ACHAPJ_012946 [Fusarium lateritium]